MYPVRAARSSPLPELSQNPISMRSDGEAYTLAINPYIHRIGVAVVLIA